MKTYNASSEIPDSVLADRLLHFKDAGEWSKDKFDTEFRMHTRGDYLLDFDMVVIEAARRLRDGDSKPKNA